MEHLLVLLLRNVTHLSQQGTRRFRHHVKLLRLSVFTETSDKHKHSNIYVTVASRLLYLCAEVSLIQQTNYRNASKCDSIRWLAGCTKSPTELVLPGSDYNWVSIDQHKLFMNITPGEYSESSSAGERLPEICGLCQNKMSQYLSGQCLRTNRAF